MPRETYYRKSHGLIKAFEEYQRKPPLIWGAPWVATKKIDGTQIWIHMIITGDSFTFSLRSHGGGDCFTGSSDMTLEKLTEKTYYYQKVNLSLILPPVLKGFFNLLKEQGLTESHFYCEATLPGKTPCQLPYPDEMKSRIWFFNQVYGEEGEEKIKISLTPQNITTYTKHGIPTVPIIMSGDSLTLEDFSQILDWCTDHEGEEGLVFYQPHPNGSLLKIKTHHANALVKPKPEGLPEKLDTVYDLYLEALSESKIIQAKRKRFEKRQKEKDDQVLTPDQIQIEIAKEFTHDSHQDFLEKYQAEEVHGLKNHLLGMSEWRKKVFQSLEEEYGHEKTRKSKKTILAQMAKYLDDQKE